MKILAGVGLSVALLGPLGCATVDLPPATTGAGVLEKDERNLWVQSERIAADIRSSRMLYEDENLSSYLDSVARHLFPAQVSERFRFKVNVLKDPRLNAFALPNGEVFLHTGILARMDNEAQLAALLAHEMTHATHRHSVRSLRDLKNKSAFFSITTIGGGGYGAVLGPLGFMASVSGYSRDMEREADEEGYKLVVRSGYDPREWPRLFEHLKEELEASEVEEPFFFGSHPKLQERIDNSLRLAGESGPIPDGRIETETFLSRTNGLVLENAALNLVAGRYGMAGKCIERYMGRNPRDAKGFCLQGRIIQQRDAENADPKAAQSYEKALEIDPDLAEAHKGLGLIAYKVGDWAEAVAHLELYIERSPAAADRAYIETYIAKAKSHGGKP